MDDLLELFKGQLSYEYFEKFTYRELDALKNARIARFEKQKEEEELRAKQRGMTVR